MKVLVRLFLMLTVVLGAFSVEARSQAVKQSGDTSATVEVPQGYELSAAYPNPFNPSTTFSLRVEKRQQVTVEVYNLLGVRVRSLFRGVMDADQKRSFTFEADNLPSGIYLYRVQGEFFTATRQVTLLK